MNLSELRRRMRGVKMSRLVSAAQAPRSTVQDIASGRTANPGINTVRRIEAALMQLESDQDNLEQGLCKGPPPDAAQPCTKPARSLAGRRGEA